MRLALALLAAVSAFAGPAEEYERMREWKFSPAMPLPAGGITIERDTATWTLQSGSVRVMRGGEALLPVRCDSSEQVGGTGRSACPPQGVVTGVVFEGTGRFRMTVPDRFELLQLRRFTGKRELVAIDEPITQLVLRTNDAAIIDLFPRAAEGAAYAPYPLAEKRHEQWLTKLFNDVDAQLVAAMLNPGGLRTTIDAKTAAFHWLTWDYDSARAEEITLTSHQPKLAESWISLDRPEDRLAHGRPGGRSSAPVILGRVEVKADLTKRGRIGEVGRNRQRTVLGEYDVTISLAGVAEETRAARLNLWAVAREVKAFDESGAELPLLRDHIGKRSAMLDNRLHDNDLVVLLREPLRRGETTRIRFTYELETANFVPGSVWYPTVPDGLEQKHTGRLEITVHRKNEVRAMGTLESRSEDERTERTVWKVEQPVQMLTFSTATRFEEVKLDGDGVPDVFAFGPDYQFGNTERMRDVAADVADSLRYFQRLLDHPLEPAPIYVTSIASPHGQAFAGFLHMGEFTFGAESAGASELFRAHEVAHEWFGHKVGFRSYRDQWLSEALAEYAAMMFVRDEVKNGEKHHEEILRSYEGVVHGNLAGGFSKFSRPWLIERSSAERRRMGPIGHGVRATTAEIPVAYVIQTYYKAPLVLHMLRMHLFFRDGHDDVFRAVLRDFVREYAGRSATTADFQRLLERRATGDWNWFFDSWIHRAEIPSYVWSHDAAPSGGGFALTVKLQRRDVSDGFATVIPLRVELEDGTASYFFLFNDRDEQSFTQQLPSRPKSVVLAPEHSLLGSVRRN